MDVGADRPVYVYDYLTGQYDRSRQNIRARFSQG